MSSAATSSLYAAALVEAAAIKSEAEIINIKNAGAAISLSLSQKLVMMNDVEERKYTYINIGKQTILGQ